MIHNTLTIKNKLGLHARAASKLVEITSRYQSNIRLRKHNSDKPINGKSIMDLMMFDAGEGTNVLLEVEGPDERNAYEAILTVLANAFGEEA